MPVSLAYDLSKLARETDENILFYQQKYNSYLEEYAEKDENGGFKFNLNKTGFLLKEETINEAQAKFNELDNFNFSINAPLISLSDLDSLHLSPATLNGLIPFLKAE